MKVGMLLILYNAPSSILKALRIMEVPIFQVYVQCSRAESEAIPKNKFYAKTIHLKINISSILHLDATKCFWNELRYYVRFWFIN